MLLFRVATGEAWQLIMLACIEAECDEVSSFFAQITVHQENRVQMHLGVHTFISALRLVQ